MKSISCLLSAAFGFGVFSIFTMASAQTKVTASRTDPDEKKIDCVMKNIALAKGSHAKRYISTVHSNLGRAQKFQLQPELGSQTKVPLTADSPLLKLVQGVRLNDSRLATEPHVAMDLIKDQCGYVIGATRYSASLSFSQLELPISEIGLKTKDHTADKNPATARLGITNGSLVMMRPSERAKKGNFLIINIHTTPNSAIQPYQQPTLVIPVSASVADAWEAQVKLLKAQPTS